MPALTQSMCRGSSTRGFDPVLTPSGNRYSTIGYCRLCGRMVCLTDGRKLYRHNVSGHDSSWVQWIKRELERA